MGPWLFSGTLQAWCKDKRETQIWFKDARSESEGRDDPD